MNEIDLRVSGRITIRNGKSCGESGEGFLAVKGVADRLITLEASALIDVMVVGADSAGPIAPIIAIVTNCPEKHCTAAKSTYRASATCRRARRLPAA
jgi:hypothetical protein